MTAEDIFNHILDGARKSAAAENARELDLIPHVRPFQRCGRWQE